MTAAYNLARWLMRNEHDAEDAVQEAYLRAFRFVDGFHGGASCAWLLALVRNTGHTWLAQNRRPTALVENLDLERSHRAIEELQPGFREAMVLRELEGLSYKEIGAVIGGPPGTVMSRLARARAGLQRASASPRRAGGAA